MSLTTKLLVLILASFTLIIGFFVTFSLILGKESPFELFAKIEILTNLYLLFGILLIIGIIIFGIFLFLKEKLFSSS